jgi:hypothetical protein
VIRSFLTRAKNPIALPPKSYFIKILAKVKKLTIPHFKFYALSQIIDSEFEQSLFMATPAYGMALLKRKAENRKQTFFMIRFQ